MSRKTSWWLVMLAAVVALAVHGAGAADRYWTNGLGGQFDTAGNWDAGVPGPTDYAYFNTAATYQVAWTAGATNQKAYFGSTTGTGMVTLAIGGGNEWIVTNGMQIGQAAGSVATVRMTSGTMWVTNFAATNAAGEMWGNSIMKLGESGRGSFVLEGGTATVNQIDLGLTTSSNSVLITGTNTLLNIGRASQFAIQIGANGYANGYNTFTITNGARVIANGSGLGGLYTIAIYGQYQKVMVAGSNTFLLVTNNNIGFYSHDNEMRISGGAECQLPSGIYFGASDALGICSNNVFRVTGSGTVLKAATGTADLMGKNNRYIVENGAQCIASGYLGVGGGNNSFFLIDGTGTVFTVSADIYAYSDEETPCVIVTNGAKLVSAGGRLGGDGGANKKCVVVVTGNGTIWTNTGAISVGHPANSSGNLMVSNGATVYGTSATIANSAGSTGIVYVTGSGSLWTNSGNVSVSGSSRSGTLQMGDGGVAAMNTLTASSTGTLAFVASSTSAGTINVQTLTVDTTSKLNINLTNCAVGNAVYTLVNYNSMPVKFAESNITVNTRPNFLAHSRYVLDQSTGNKITLTLTLPAGTIFTIY